MISFMNKCDDCVNHPMYIRGKADAKAEHDKECDRCQYSLRKEVIEEVRENAIDALLDELKAVIFDAVIEIEKRAEKLKEHKE